MSRPSGINTPDHGGHDNGNIVDVRPIRNDSQTGDAANLDYNSPSYHLDFTKEIFRMIKKLYPNIYIRFNDGKIAGQGEFTYVHKDPKAGKAHNDHFHLEFRQGGKDEKHNCYLNFIALFSNVGMCEVGRCQC